MHLQDDLLDSPQIRRTSGNPVWMARLTVLGWTINGKSRFKALARIKAFVNTATWNLTGCPASNRLRWD